ncbi:MAG: ABC transporter permease [Undibacterium sp.]|nr:ABC transporter permease [Opitutaceae bacterium]
MHTILVLVRKDFTNFFRNKPALLLTFVIPFVMIYLFGQIFGINRKDSGPNGIPLAVVNLSDNPGAAKLVDALKAEKSFRVLTKFVNPDKSTRPLTEADARALMQGSDAPFRFALVIPADLISTKTIGLRFKILSNPRNEIETQTVNGVLQKTIFTNVPELLAQSLQARAKDFLGDARLQKFNGAIAGAVAGTFGGDKAQIERDLSGGDFGISQLTQSPKPADPTLRRLDPTPAPARSAASVAATASAAPKSDPPTLDSHPSPAASAAAQIIKFETEQVVGANVKSPAATAIVGGWAIQFLLFALSASAVSLFRERDAGIFQRLLASPVTRAQILLGKFVYGVSIGLIQLLVLFFAGRILFGIEVEKHLGLLILVCAFAAAACTSFGMLLAAIAPNAEAANGMATFLIMMMSALGGAWFPISLMPQFIQQFSKLTLVYWSMEGFSNVLWAGMSFVQLLPVLGILGGITAVVMSLAIWRFNRGKIFE